MGYVIALIALFGLMYLLLIRPQRRRQHEQSQMQETLTPGTEILTAGGIHGTVQCDRGRDRAPGDRARHDRPPRPPRGRRDRGGIRARRRNRGGEPGLDRRKLICPDSRRVEPTFSSDPGWPDRGRARGRDGHGRAQLARAQEGRPRPRSAGRARGRAEGGPAEGEELRRRLHGALDLDHAQPHRQARRLGARDPQAGQEPDRDPARRRPRRQQGGTDHREHRPAAVLRPRERRRRPLERRQRQPRRHRQPLPAADEGPGRREEGDAFRLLPLQPEEEARQRPRGHAEEAARHAPG